MEMKGEKEYEARSLLFVELLSRMRWRLVARYWWFLELFSRKLFVARCCKFVELFRQRERDEEIGLNTANSRSSLGIRRMRMFFDRYRCCGDLKEDEGLKPDTVNSWSYLFKGDEGLNLPTYQMNFVSESVFRLHY